MDRVATRIAPSPTGRMHIGTVRTALFNFLIARRYGGTYFVRIEDTDKARNEEAWVDDIWNDFAWCGLEPDKKFRQSQHLERHKELLRVLLESGKAYVSREPAKNDPTKEVEVVRLKNPGKTVVFADLIRGEVSVDTTDLGDFVIARAIDDPLYHLAVVIDDADAGVTHIIRAEEHISNTPRQILIQEALGFPRPAYAHLPLILAPDRSKLSKRKHGASIENYREQGYIPEAIINYLALLGWNPGTEEELFSLEELIERFSFDKLQKSGAIFDETKLRWFNKEHLRRLPPEEYYNRLVLFIEHRGGSVPSYLREIAGLLLERAETLGEAADLIKAGEFSFMEGASVTKELLLRGAKTDIAEVQENLAEVHRILGMVAEENWNAGQIKEAIFPFAENAGKAQVLWPLRVSLSGREKSPDPFVLAALIGKKKVLERVNEAAHLP
ncbi:MAG: glutamate--tRNA ligase [Minisyncoccia bacterium]